MKNKEKLYSQNITHATHMMLLEQKETSKQNYKKKKNSAKRILALL